MDATWAGSPMTFLRSSNENRKTFRRDRRLVVRGQIQTMKDSFVGLLAGLAFSILLVYFLIVMNFQSWLDPFIILMALPAALAGIVWMLFVTGTTISVPALTGAIMCMGVATANSILVVSFSKERLEAGKTPMEAALEAGFTRFRPGSHDRSGDDHRDASDVAGFWRRRRAKCSAGPRRHRRFDICDGRHTFLCPGILQPHSRSALRAVRGLTPVLRG